MTQQEADRLYQTDYEAWLKACDQARVRAIDTGIYDPVFSKSLNRQEIALERVVSAINRLVDKLD